MFLLRAVDNFLNNITMYRLVLYGLRIEVFAAIVLSFFGVIFYSWLQMVLSLVVLIVVCFGSNILFSKLFKAPSNTESSLITALILFFILTPPANAGELLPIVLTGVLAMISKYVFALRRKHIFNPVAVALVIVGILGFGIAGWWVATPSLLPVTLVVGLLIVRKIRRYTLFFTFLVTSILVIAGSGIQSGYNPVGLFAEVFTSWPLIFFGTIMLTEPLTTPPTQKLRIVYGVLVGILFGLQFQIGPIYSSPEVALVIGNIFSFLVSSRQKLFLTLQEKIQLAPHIYEFIFIPDQRVSFRPGQYLEWTLPMTRTDARGNRRYFTIASSPTEQELHLGVRVSEKGSSYKKALLRMEKGGSLVASQLTGDFTLPVDRSKKLVFITGGIGVTPFRSMIKYLSDIREKRDIVLFYANSTPSDFVYEEIFEQAKEIIPLKVIYVITKEDHVPSGWSGRVGHITEQMIKEEVPDYKERLFYLSGPQAMVDAYKYMLHRLSVSKRKIITDYFPGF